MATNVLNNARNGKNDEFYTQLTDIEAEMRYYKDHFKGKTVLCNCDDPYESNFFKYFAMNFNYLGLKKLIATCYADSVVAGTQLSMLDVQSFDEACSDTIHPYKVEITEVCDENADGAVDLTDVEVLLKNRKNVLKLLKGDGDFRSVECINLLKEADVVVTNPPFSLFREYVAQLEEYNKNYIIIGNKNAITYKEIFRLIKRNLFFVGNRPMAGGMWFAVPDHYMFDKIVDDIKLKNVPSCWFTNFDIAKHHDFLTLYKQYSPKEYPKYVNYDAIEVSKTADIPYDYIGEMGVPITFLDKYNPDQFEIIGSSWTVGNPISEFAEKGTYMSGGMRFYLPIGDGTYRRLYDRIVIKRKGSAQ